jgi:Na+/phosphate symporter
MHEMGRDVEDCILLLQNAFINNSSMPLQECRLKIEGMKKTEPRLTGTITELTRDNPALRPYISVPVHLLRIAENIEKLADLMDRKIREDILFSDRAMTEITFLLQRLGDMLRPMSDIMLARNIILSRYIQESEAGVIRRAIEYATFHEERLIEGLCLPVASSLYIGMLDAIKGIAWHAKEIATRLAE